MAEVIIFDELDSTNAEARRRAEVGERGPVWLLARRQTAGRGRRGRAWAAGQGNLTATVLLTLDKTPLQAAQLAFVAGLAAGRTVAAYIPASLVRLKWPNDVLIGDRKVCGMLIESGPAAGGGLWLAIGFGLNLANYPEVVERPATAVAEHLRHDVLRAPTPDEALSLLTRDFDETLSVWLEQGFEPIRWTWTRMAAGIGAPCTARLESETVEGIAEGLDEDGALLLRLVGGQLRRITAGDVFFGAGH